MLTYDLQNPTDTTPQNPSVHCMLCINMCTHKNVDGENKRISRVADILIFTHRKKLTVKIFMYVNFRLGLH